MHDRSGDENDGDSQRSVSRSHIHHDHKWRRWHDTDRPGPEGRSSEEPLPEGHGANLPIGSEPSGTSALPITLA